ncbi:MAG: UxaA family hydrolase [Thermanaeromonas sp.]|uniref:UxaA family hydrolase n=1 Tax=Thermanaeromonas sp. TaxID=2003697 RepID=UPI00243B0622|nr:UxaA family hydrolase [Thermanaeromonas sp.]MCG0277149.1 UxaA family hydrolase [Thermanaeromonas sp.]
MPGTKFLGYRRENGRVGVRNHVVILPLDDLSNTAAEGVAKLVEGTIALPHPYGRLQFGEDLELFFRTLIGTGSNPNVAACIVIGIEPKWTNRVVEGIAATKKPVTGFAIERYGDLKVIEMAARKAVEYVQYATELKKEECDVSELVVSIKCGESDTTSGLASNPALGNAVDRLVDMGATVLFGETSELTGGEHLVAERCATPEIREQFMRSFTSYSEFIMSQGVDLIGSQPTEGNITGGLTTIEEKALGNIQKIGKRSLIQGVLQPAEPPKGKGLWYMETSSAAAECITLFAAGGSVLHFFTTGQGNIVGHPIIPVIKISANPITVSTMSEHIDVDLSGILRREMNLEEAGTKILEEFFRTLNGRFTKAEALGHKEFVLTKLYRSA